MEATTMQAVKSPNEAIVDIDPQPRRWNREEYYKMGDAGLFHGQKVELLGGEIFLHDAQASHPPRPISISRRKSKIRSHALDPRRVLSGWPIWGFSMDSVSN